jgi:hypothetical protein
MRHISMSYIERPNVKRRQAIRRFTRLTNALKAACSLHFAYYSLRGTHQTLGFNPAIESGIMHHLWSMAEFPHSM